MMTGLGGKFMLMRRTTLFIVGDRRMTTRALCTLVWLGLVTGCAPVPVGGVNPVSIPVGTRARIVEPAGSKDYIKLSVLGATHDSLRYQLNPEAAPASLPWQRVDRMDVSAGRHSNFLAGFGIGVLAGAAAGALIGSSSADGNDGMTPSAVGALGALTGAVGGGIAGGLVGIAVRTEKWVPVRLPR
jgi:hypothetical protein